MISIKDFRLYLINNDSESYSTGYKLIIDDIDKNEIFTGTWTAGKPILEVYPKFSVKAYLQVKRNAKKVYNESLKLSLEAPRTDNPQDFYAYVARAHFMRAFKVACTVAFEHPELINEFPKADKRVIYIFLKYQGTFQKKELADELEKYIGIPERPEKDIINSIDRFTGCYDRDDVIEFMNNSNSYFDRFESYKINWEEYIILGWFKEILHDFPDSPWLAYYLRKVSVQEYNIDDFKLILLYTKTVEEKRLKNLTESKAFDMFWDNSDEIYKFMFHDNIIHTPVRLVKVYVTLFLSDEGDKREN